MSSSPKGGLTTPATIPVTISGGTPSPTSVTINVGDTLQFTNNDSIPYLIKLYTNPGASGGNAKHIDVCPVIYTGADNTLSFMAVPSLANGNGKCTYDVLQTDGSPASPTTTGGTHVIIIGSGTNTDCD